MEKYKAPCLGCKERHEHCHSECEAYLTYKADIEELNRRIREEKDSWYWVNEKRPKNKKLK